MSIVTERINANKTPPPQADVKSGKLGAGQINNNKDLDVDAKKDEPSFFGSFFAKGKNQAAAKKGVSTMEAVCLILSCLWLFLTLVDTSLKPLFDPKQL